MDYWSCPQDWDRWRRVETFDWNDMSISSVHSLYHFWLKTMFDPDPTLVFHFNRNVNLVLDIGHWVPCAQPYLHHWKLSYYKDIESIHIVTSISFMSNIGNTNVWLWHKENENQQYAKDIIYCLNTYYNIIHTHIYLVTPQIRVQSVIQ